MTGDIALDRELDRLDGGPDPDPTQEEREQYWLMDGRAVFDIDKAIVLEVCETYQEAWSNRNDYGADTCIVLVADGGHTLLHCLMWEREADDDLPFLEKEI